MFMSYSLDTMNKDDRVSKKSIQIVIVFFSPLLCFPRRDEVVNKWKVSVDVKILNLE